MVGVAVDVVSLFFVCLVGGDIKIASISKLYDAVSVTKLVNDGRLSLDKTIADYLPELVGRIENSDKITLKLMIRHRSGIPNFTDAPNYWGAPTEIFEESLVSKYHKDLGAVVIALYSTTDPKL